MLGLLGTLLGLINAFAGMAMTGSVDARALGAGVSEALIMTALGLVIGLPAWWATASRAWAERIAARAEAASPSPEASSRPASTRRRWPGDGRERRSPAARDVALRSAPARISRRRRATTRCSSPCITTETVSVPGPVRST